jgi:hypothetical protein
MLLQGLSFRLARCEGSWLVQDRLHIGNRRLLLISHRTISLVDILIVIKESVLNVKCEATDGLAW